MKHSWYFICIVLLMLAVTGCESSNQPGSNGSKSKKTDRSDAPEKVDPDNPPVIVACALEGGKALPNWIRSDLSRTTPDNAANTLQSAGFTEIDYLYEGVDFLEYKAPDDVEVIMIRASKYADNGGGVTVSLTYYDDILGHYFVGGLYPTATAIKGVFLPWSEALDQYMGGDNWEGEIQCYADGKGVMKTRTAYVKFLQDHHDMSKYEYSWVDEQWKSGNIESELYLNTYDSDIPKGFVRIWFSIDLNLY